MSNSNPCASTCFLNDYQSKQADDDREQMIMDDIIDDRVAGRLATLQADDLQALIGDIGGLTTPEDAHDEELFTVVAQKIACYYTDKTPANARALGESLAAFVGFAVRCDEVNGLDNL